MIKCLVCRVRIAQDQMAKGFTCNNCTDVLTSQGIQLRDGESYDSYRGRIFGLLAVA